MNKNVVVSGSLYGDEGKGRLADYLADKAKVCVRFNGSNNAGHSIHRNNQKFITHIIPSGVISGNIGVITNGCFIDPTKLIAEIEEMRSKGINITPDNLKISYACHITTPLHIAIDVYTEEQLGANKIGSTKTGNSPTAIDKYARRGLRMLELTNPDKLRNHYPEEAYIQLAEKYSVGLSYSQFIDQLTSAGQQLLPYMTDTSLYLSVAVKKGGVIFEGAQSTLLDIDYAAYPNCTAGNCLASYAAVSGGFGHQYIHETIGVVKAFVSQVGSGYLPTRMPEEIEDGFREFSGEYGATTGRKRKLGWLDLPMLRYSVRVNGLTSLAITRLDTLNWFEKVKVCDYYLIDGKEVYDLPMDRDLLAKAVPHYVEFEGWKDKNINSIRKKSMLPGEMLDFLDFIEDSVEAEFGYISVGKNKDEMIEVA